MKELYKHAFGDTFRKAQFWLFKVEEALFVAFYSFQKNFCHFIIIASLSPLKSSSPVTTLPPNLRAVRRTKVSAKPICFRSLRNSACNLPASTAKEISGW